MRTTTARSIVLTTMIAAQPIAAQCQPTWLPGTGTQGVGLSGTVPGSVYAHTEWDPDGAGPAAPLMVIAGHFWSVGDTAANNIAAIDPATRAVTAFGSGTNAPVRGVAVAANGDLLAVGEFSQAGGTAALWVARWDGTSWSALGNGLPTWGDSVIGLPNGDVLVGGAFSGAGQQNSLIRRWNGANWAPTSYPGIANPFVTVKQMRLLQNGDLVAAGTLGVKRLVGGSWVDIGPALNDVETILELPNGDLVAGGGFTTPIAAGERIARWDGAAWLPMGSGMDDRVETLARLPNGDVIAGGRFATAGGVPCSHIARWDGSGWSALGGGTSYSLNFGDPPGVHTLALVAGGELYAGGFFTTAGGGAADSIASWDGTAWSPLFPGTNGPISAVVELANGDLVVGGAFTTIGGVAAARVARFDGVTWHALGSGLDAQCMALTVAANGDLVAGGEFAAAGGAAAAHVASWDGTTWTALGAGTNDLVLALATLPNGDIVAGGSFSIAGGAPAPRMARWNGSAWSPFGSADAAVTALLVTDGGDLIAGGYFNAGFGNHVARFDGTSWSPLGAGIAPIVLALAELPDGDLVAGGAFPLGTNRVHRWDGATWSPLGGAVQDRVDALAPLPNGDVVAGGGFASIGGVAIERLARWDGASWSELAGGVRGAVRALTLRADRELVVAGGFAPSTGAPTANFAQLASTCPAVVAGYGVGCSGAAGPLSLASDDLPWVGGTWTSTASGFAPNTIALWELGLATASAPVAALHPAGGPGCIQWLQPLVLTAAIPSGGAVTLGLTIPDSPNLAGFVLHNMAAGIELDASSNITRIATTNGLTLNVGVF